MAGVTAAIDVLAGIDPGPGTGRRSHLADSYRAIHAHESALLARLEAGLAELGDRVTVYSRAVRRTPTVLMTFAGRPAAEVSAALATRGIHAPSSNFYGLEASRALGLGDTGGLRAGLAPYTTEDEIDRLLEALGDVLSRDGGAPSSPRSSRPCRGRRPRAASTTSRGRARGPGWPTGCATPVGGRRADASRRAPPPMSPPTRLGFQASSSAGLIVCRASTRSRNPGANRSMRDSMRSVASSVEPCGT